MKYIKKYRYFLIAAALILAILPFQANAADDQEFDIVGWHDESCHSAVTSVKVNGTELSELNTCMYDSVAEVPIVKAEASDTISVEITLEDGYALSSIGGNKLWISGVQSESDHIIGSSNTTSIQLPAADWYEQDKELYLSFKTVRKPKSGSSVTKIDKIVLNVGKINCCTEISDPENFTPKVSVPSGKGYSIVPDSLCLVEAEAGTYIENVSPFIVKKNRTAIFRVDLIDKGAYVFSDKLKKSNITIKNGKLLDFELFTLGGTDAKSKAHELCLTVSVDTNHKWDAGKITKKTSYKSAGTKLYTCSVCKGTKTEVIPKLNDTLIVKMTAKGKNSLVLSWTKVDQVDGYDIFLTRCDGETSKKMKKIKTIKGNKKFTYTVKKLEKKKAYKTLVKAWKKKNGKKTYIKKSLTYHAYTSGGSKKYTNPKSVKVNKTAVTLKKGKTFQIKASVAKLNSKKQLLEKGHAAKLRYLTSDKKVATVTKSGKIKAVGRGSCKVYVVAVNGIYKAVSVTVN